ncbi:MAG: SurA N-terminal domain-containing protein [Nitrospiraceae bacterium]|nr:SurA N-terminal domain-containing protein [Nitrospiraceae bacterium]
MLKVMRHNAKYFYVLFFIVILSFIFWGVGNVDKGQQERIVAEVDGLKIPAEEYFRAYDRALGFYRDLYKEKLDEEMLKKLNLKENILNSMIDSKVLLLEAKKEGVTISDDELNEAIRKDPAFMNNGAFDRDVYMNRLRLNRLTPEVYEAAKRQEMMIARVRRTIELGAPLPEADLAKLTGDDQNVRQIREALINSAKEKAVKSYIEGLKKGLKITINKDVMAS